MDPPTWNEVSEHRLTDFEEPSQNDAQRPFVASQRSRRA